MVTRRNRHPLVFTAMLIALIHPGGFSQSSSRSVDFFQEEVDVEVLGDSCRVTGVYHFRNQTARPVTARLLYPFPRRAELQEPDRIDVLDLTSNKGLHVEKRSWCVLFPIALPPWGEASYRVRYIQSTPMGLMEYLLTTARAWGRPLERATLSVRIPDTLRMTYLSFPRDTIWRSDGGTTYAVFRQHFSPDRELSVRWQRRARP